MQQLLQLTACSAIFGNRSTFETLESLNKALRLVVQEYDDQLTCKSIS